MIKVILTTAEGQMTDLFPESFTFRDVFRELHEDYVGKTVLVDGELIPDEKLWSSLLEYRRGDMMHIEAVAMPENVEKKDPYVVVVSPEEDEYRSIYNEIVAMREKMNGLISKLKGLHPEWTVSF